MKKKYNSSEWKKMANAIRALTMDSIEKANSGHPGLPMGMADVVTVLFSQFMQFSPLHPHWQNRDRFVLSAGHGSMLLYSLLYLSGYKDMTLEDLKAFRQLSSRTPGHPEYGFSEGIETTTGPLGQGLANAVGMAITEKWLATRFGEKIVNHKTYVLVGDGCLMEGISQEAISIAGHLKLNNLIVLFDDNGITIDGRTDLATSEDHIMRLKACGWKTLEVNGHDFDAIAHALEKAQISDRPVFIACKTIIAKGAPHKQGTSEAHGAPLGEKEAAAARTELNWPYSPFEIPQDILALWRTLSQQGETLYYSWNDHLNASENKFSFEAYQKREFTSEFEESYKELLQNLIKTQPSWATRQASQFVLDSLASHIPQLLGGSADLTGSNNTQAKSMQSITPTDFSGNYLHYGIREHAMAAIMNGMVLHGGIIPYGGTFLTFSDYCRPAIRLSALMEIPVIYVMTHDSIGLGEDGPTHQPIEHLMSLRMIPNLCVFRPADAVEVAECWKIALESQKYPSILALSRQKLPTLRKTMETENLSAKGAYVLKPAEGHQRITLIATGSEVSLAIEVQAELMKEGLSASVVSMPCWKLFDQQEEHYKQKVLGNHTLRVAIEAGSTFGWEKYVGAQGIIIGMTTFGASAPYQDLYKNFGFTIEAITHKIKNYIG